MGFLLVLYGVSLWVLGGNKFEVGGSAYMVLAGVFLALIGVYPGGTRPHVFVSSWFFVQADMALILVTLGAWIRLRSRLSYAGFWASLAAFPVAFLLDMIFPWPSAAVLETYGILVIDIVALLVYIDYRRVVRA